MNVGYPSLYSHQYATMYVAIFYGKGREGGRDLYHCLLWVIPHSLLLLNTGKNRIFLLINHQKLLCIDYMHEFCFDAW